MVQMDKEILGVDEYIKSFPAETQSILNRMRAIIKEVAPHSGEGMAYKMPSYRTNGKPLVYFAGYEKHIGFYATLTGHSQFSEELSKYKQGKGSVQFPLNKEIPYDLIKRIVEFRVVENGGK